MERCFFGSPLNPLPGTFTPVIHRSSPNGRASEHEEMRQATDLQTTILRPYEFYPHSTKVVV